MYNYVKALHIIFIVTWFSGLFYIVRLFIYAAEAADRDEPEKSILVNQFLLMQKRLWYGITWPSFILTFIFGPWMWYLMGGMPQWLMIKLCFVVGLLLYHLSLHYIFKLQQKKMFTFSSNHLRLWNEVATIFLVAIVMIAVVKQFQSIAWAIGGLMVFVLLLFLAIRIYKRFR